MRKLRIAQTTDCQNPKLKEMAALASRGGPSRSFSSANQGLAIEIAAPAAHESIQLVSLATSLIRARRFPSESRKNVIHRSWVGIFAITWGSSSKRTPLSFSFP